MPIFGIDITEWLALASLLVLISSAFNRTLKKIQQNSDEHNKAMFEAFKQSMQHNNDVIKLQVGNVTKSIDNLAESNGRFIVREQEHYTEHEKHLVQNDIKLQVHDDTLEDHENRIKNNEDDIDRLKDELIQQKKASGN